jgi:hypothetical protein
MKLLDGARPVHVVGRRLAVTYKGRLYPVSPDGSIDLAAHQPFPEDAKTRIARAGELGSLMAKAAKPEGATGVNQSKSKSAPPAPKVLRPLTGKPIDLNSSPKEAPSGGGAVAILTSDPATPGQAHVRSIVDLWDVSQLAVIGAETKRRLIVEAGPGTGKTAVSCARLAHLIREGGVQPSKTWMISFTRTAVAEIRSRLYGYLGEDAFAVKVATVDAHAWSIHSGFDERATLTGTYEENIQHVHSLITNDEEVQEYLEGVEHLLIDEAQDLIGQRADLIEALIRKLDNGCGITVFADEAQAIYAFSEESIVNRSSEPFLDRLRRDKGLRFETKVLDTIHRTSAAGLRAIFSDVRSEVIARGKGLFTRVRESIVSHADGSGLSPAALGIDALPRGSLILFRTRPEALEASQFCSMPHSLRLSGYGANLPPWIALCFYDFTNSHMSRQEFMQRWLSRVENSCPPDYGAEEAWSRLTRFGGAADGSLEMNRLRVRLGRQSPPVEITTQEFGLPGPVVGTIHASKGREADNVYLLIPQGEEFKSREDEEEETRVLFVGSTRARTTLHVGNARQWPGRSLDKDKARAYRTLKKGERAAMVEIGRPEDINLTGLAGKSLMNADECAFAQQWLATHACVLTTLKVASDPDLKWSWRLIDPQTDHSLAVLSLTFGKEMWDIATIIGKWVGAKLRPPLSINYVRAFGSRTIVISPNDPQLERLHTPWAVSGFLLAPRVAAFTRAKFGTIK